MKSSAYEPLSTMEQMYRLLSPIRVVAFDFDGVFTDNAVYVNQDGIESVRCWRGDGIGLARIREMDVHTVIISTEENPVVTARAKKLKISCKQGISDKVQAIMDFCHQLDIDMREAAFVGNDVNDIPALKAVGLPIAVFDAHPEILPHVLYRTICKGGHGAVREVCDLIFHAKHEALKI